MNCDELLQCTNIPDVGNDAIMTKKERLYSLATCGKTRQCLGTEFSFEQIQHMSDQDIEKYYRRYEAHLGSRMVKSVGQTVLSLYTKIISQLAPIDSEQDFMYDLNQDPVLTRSLECLGCDLYYRFGSYLAPLITGLITVNHINFSDIKNGRQSSDSSGETTEPGESNDTELTSD